MHPRIRPIALAVILRDGAILVAEGYDAVKQQRFYRPPGGGIEFGETGAAAVIREIREELDLEVAILRDLGTVENIFTFQARAGHEIVRLFLCGFVDPSAYAVERFLIQEWQEEGVPATWVPLSHFAGGEDPLYPDGLFDLLSLLPHSLLPQNPGR